MTAQETALSTAIRVVINLLVRGEYTTLEKVTRGRRLSADELRDAVARYGRKLVPPPDAEWWDTVDIERVVAKSDGQRFQAAVPLWTEEEGRSDLTIELMLTETGADIYDVEIQDLHVL